MISSRVTAARATGDPKNLARLRRILERKETAARRCFAQARAELEQQIRHANRVLGRSAAFLGALILVATAWRQLAVPPGHADLAAPVAELAKLTAMCGLIAPLIVALESFFLMLRCAAVVFRFWRIHRAMVQSCALADDEASLRRAWRTVRRSV